MIILEYKNWAGNMCNLASVIMHIGTSNILCSTVDYSTSIGYLHTTVM